MASRDQVFTGFNYMKMPDGTELLMSKIENLGLPNQKVTHYISQEQRQEFSRKMMRNAGEVMSEYYAQKERRGLQEQEYQE